MLKKMLKVEKLNVGYAGVDVLRGVSLTVNAGEIVSVVGANGGGKSTLLKTISGLMKPSFGSIEFMESGSISWLPTRYARRG